MYAGARQLRLGFTFTEALKRVLEHKSLNTLLFEDITDLGNGYDLGRSDSDGETFFIALYGKPPRTYMAFADSTYS